MTLAALLRHLAFAAGIALVSAVVVRAMINARVMDLPNGRSAHAVPTPRGGGLGIVVAFLLGIAVLYGFASFARLADPYFRGVILASIAIAVVGFIDDLRDWPFTVKLAAQVGAALAAVGSGLYVEVFRIPVIGAVDIGWLAGAAVTVAWILFATNAMNFIDGLNGLAAGTALVACAFLALIAGDAGRLVRLFRRPAAGRRHRRLPAVQLPARAHLHGRRGQPVLRLCPRRARRGRQPVRQRWRCRFCWCRCCCRACCTTWRSPWCAGRWPASG